MKLDIGGRINAPEGYKTLDRVGPADYIVDLEKPPKRMEKAMRGAFSEIRAHHVLEHVRNICELMDWLWVILEPGGKLDIVVPHKDHGAAWHDPTHVRYFTRETFDYFTGRLAYFGYVKHPWEYVSAPRMVGDNMDFISVILAKPSRSV